ncbi:MAG TPA: hypothetical protein VF721_03325 [Pyrinomonadaceae bacterium]|jgi:hypothetical protein
MEFEFDKEIDSLLRRTAKGESVQTFDAHLDADEISLFAENALTAKSRTYAVGHLAECAKCRKILSHLISFNAETESETIHAGESNIIPVAAQAIPWYRRLFAFPQVTFAMGALVLVFSGIMAFLVLQSANESEQSTSIAQREPMRETTTGTSGASSDGETSSVETYSSNSTANVSPGMMGNTNAATTAVSNTTVSNSASVSPNSGNIALPVVRQQPQAEKNEETAKRENSYLPDGQATPNAPPQNKPDVTVTTNVPAKDNNQPRPTDRARDDDERKLSTSDAMTESQRREPSPKSALKKSAGEDKNKAGEARAAGGKTFRNVGGIWFDSAYTSQPQVMIRRGSDDYRRLDSGLRSIAESLGGTIVVVWKSKAYRIH